MAEPAGAGAQDGAAASGASGARASMAGPSAAPPGAPVSAGAETGFTMTRSMDQTRKIIEVINDWLVSERIFVKELETLDSFVNSIRATRTMTEKDITLRFSCFTPIAELSRKLIGQLEQIRAHGFGVGEPVTTVIAQVAAAYSTFLVTHVGSLTSIGRACEENPLLADTMRVHEDRHRVYFVVLFVRPVKRLHSYPSFIHRLAVLLADSKGDIDFEATQRAAVDTARMTVSLAEQVTRANDRSRVEAAIKNIAGVESLNLASPLRRLVRVGFLTKINRGRSQRRYVLLFNDLLLYCKAKSGKGSYAFCGMIPLAESSIDATPHGKKSRAACTFFVTRIGGKRYEFVADAPVVRDEWVEAVSECIRCADADAVQQLQLLMNQATGQAGAREHDSGSASNEGDAPHIMTGSRMRPTADAAPQAAGLDASASDSGASLAPAGAAVRPASLAAAPALDVISEAEGASGGGGAGGGGTAVATAVVAAAAATAVGAAAVTTSAAPSAGDRLSVAPGTSGHASSSRGHSPVGSSQCASVSLDGEDDLRTFDVNDMSLWLESIACGEHAARFSSAGIDGSALAMIDRDLLAMLGVADTLQQDAILSESSGGSLRSSTADAAPAEAKGIADKRLSLRRQAAARRSTRVTRAFSDLDVGTASLRESELILRLLLEEELAAGTGSPRASVQL